MKIITYISAYTSQHTDESINIVNELIDQQLNDFPDEDIKASQAKLNAAYDAFTAKYGLINDKKNARLFDDDSSYYLLCSLENLDENKNLKSKADMFTKRTIRPERVVTSVDTPSEALAVSIGEHGKVDLPYMAELLGTPGNYERITTELSGVIFKDPAADSIKAAEARLTEIAVLKTHIINYAKTREVYAAYRKTGYSKAFLEAHREEIALHKAAKAAFDEAGLQKLPKVKELDAEFAELMTKKKAAYPDYRKARNEMQELVRAQKNVERFFAEEKTVQENEQVR